MWFHSNSASSLLRFLNHDTFTKHASTGRLRGTRPSPAMDIYQGGVAYQVYSPQGSKPLESIRVTGGTVRKEYDKQSKSQVVAMEQVSSKIVVPKIPNTGALLVHPVVVVQIFVSQATTLLSIEFAVVDQLGKRRLTFSNSFHTIQPNPQHCKFPLQQFQRNQWIDFIFDVKQLHHNVYEGRAPVGFRGVESITLTGAHVRVRRIYTLREVPPISPQQFMEAFHDGQQQPPSGGGAAAAQRRGQGAAAHQHGGAYHMHVPSQFTLPAEVEQTQILILRGDELASPGPPAQQDVAQSSAPILPRVASAQRAKQQQANHAPNGSAAGGPLPFQNQKATPSSGRRTSGSSAGVGLGTAAAQVQQQVVSSRTDATPHRMPPQQRQRVSPGSSGGKYLDPLSAQLSSPHPPSSVQDEDEEEEGGYEHRSVSIAASSSIVHYHPPHVRSRGGTGSSARGATVLPYHRTHVDVAAEDEALFLGAGAAQGTVVSVSEHPVLQQQRALDKRSTRPGDHVDRFSAPEVHRSYLGPSAVASTNASTTASSNAFAVVHPHHSDAVMLHAPDAAAHHQGTERQHHEGQRHTLRRAPASSVGSDSDAEDFVVQHHRPPPQSQHHSHRSMSDALPPLHQASIAHTSASSPPPLVTVVPTAIMMSPPRVANDTDGRVQQDEPPSIEGSHRQHRQKGNTPSQYATQLEQLHQPPPPPADPMLACSTASSLVAARALFSSSTMMVEEQHRVEAETVRRLRMSESVVVTASSSRVTASAAAPSRDDNHRLRMAALDALQAMGLHGDTQDVADQQHAVPHHQHASWHDGYGYHNTSSFLYAEESIDKTDEQQHHDADFVGEGADRQHSTSFHFPQYDMSPPSTASGAIRYDGISDGDDDVDGAALQGTRACVDTNAFFYPHHGSSSSSSSVSSPAADSHQAVQSLGRRTSLVEGHQPSPQQRLDGSTLSTSHDDKRDDTFLDRQQEQMQSLSSAMSSSTERQQYEDMLAQAELQRRAHQRATVLDNAASQPWTAPPSRRGPTTSAMAALEALSPPPPVRISQELGAAGSSPPHPVAYEDDPARYEFDPVVGCYFDRVANRFVKPPSLKHHRGNAGGSAQPQQQRGASEVQQHPAAPGNERGASPGLRVPPKRPSS